MKRKKKPQLIRLKFARSMSNWKQILYMECQLTMVIGKSWECLDGICKIRWHV